MAEDNENIYELRSTDVQEVLSTPPRRLVLMGNTLIFCTLIIALYSLHLISIPIKQQGFAYIVSGENGSNLLLTTIHTNQKIPLKQNINLSLQNYPPNKYGYIKCKIQSATLSGDSVVLHAIVSDKVVTTQGDTLQIEPGLIGQGEITIGKTTLLKEFMKKLSL